MIQCSTGVPCSSVRKREYQACPLQATYFQHQASQIGDKASHSGTTGTGPSQESLRPNKAIACWFQRGSYSTMNPPRTRHKLSTTTPNTPLLTASAADNNIESMAIVASTSAAPLDLFILTFNAAKNLIDVPVFSAHLYGALGQNAPSTASGDGLPDLVAL